MRIGISSPVVTQQPGVASPWEADAGITELLQVAEAADTLGYAHLTCSEHVIVPPEQARQRGGTYWDPLATLGYLAARTERIQLATQVLVLGYHHPLEIAKRYGTLDRVSGGRLVLGLGVGSLREEFELLGARFEGRGAVADEAIDALRAAWGEEQPEFHGTHFDFSEVIVRPAAVRRHVPLWIGGRTQRSLRRAVTRGDGWVPFGLPSDEVRDMLARFELPAGFEVVLSTGRPVDPSGAPDKTLGVIGRLADAGATRVGVTVSADSAQHYCEQLQALVELTTTAGVAEFG